MHVILQGQWKQISRYYVPTRTPTQVASHAQKHFLRVSGNTKRRSKFAVVDALASNLHTKNGEQRGAHPGLPAADGHDVVSIPGPSSRADSLQHDRRNSMKRFSNAGGTTNSGGGALSDTFEQGIQFGRSVVSIPPVQANGVALGIPLPELPALAPYDGNAKIPMLKVLPGRIRATSTVCRPPSPSPSQKKKGDADDVPDGESRPTDLRTMYRRTKRTRFKNDTDDIGDGDGPYSSGLDALAGVAVALALHEKGGRDASTQNE